MVYPYSQSEEDGMLGIIQQANQRRQENIRRKGDILAQRGAANTNALANAIDQGVTGYMQGKQRAEESQLREQQQQAAALGMKKSQAELDYIPKEHAMAEEAHAAQIDSNKLAQQKEREDLAAQDQIMPSGKTRREEMYDLQARTGQETLSGMGIQAGLGKESLLTAQKTRKADDLSNMILPAIEQKEAMTAQRQKDAQEKGVQFVGLNTSEDPIEAAKAMAIKNGYDLATFNAGYDAALAKKSARALAMQATNFNDNNYQDFQKVKSNVNSRAAQLPLIKSEAEDFIKKQSWYSSDDTAVQGLRQSLSDRFDIVFGQNNPYSRALNGDTSGWGKVRTLNSIIEEGANRAAASAQIKTESEINVLPAKFKNDPDMQRNLQIIKQHSAQTQQRAVAKPIQNQRSDDPALLYLK